MWSRSSSTASTYSHLLYLNDTERKSYLSQTSSPKPRRDSISYFSMTSSRSSMDSERSECSYTSTPSTNPSSVYIRKMSTPKYADDHYPLISTIGVVSSESGSSQQEHSAILCAREMACVHNTFIRALNSVYNYAMTIKSSTQRCKDFLYFNQTLCKMIRRHLEVEDEFLFPAFEKLLGRPGSMEENSQSHDSFVQGFCRFDKYTSHPNTIDTFDGMVFRRIVESFAPNLVQHLHDDIPSVVALRAADSKEVRKIWKKAHKLTIQDQDVCIDGPFVLGCQDKSFLIDGQKFDFSGIPWTMEAMVRKWHAKKYADMWEFCPSDFHGNRKMLTF